MNFAHDSHSYSSVNGNFVGLIVVQINLRFPHSFSGASSSSLSGS